MIRIVTVQKAIEIESKEHCSYHCQFMWEHGLEECKLFTCAIVKDPTGFYVRCIECRQSEC